MTILITRPAPEGNALAQQLNAAGIHAMAQPLLEIVPGDGLPQLPARLNHLQPGDILIAVSAHAVDLAHNSLRSQGASWPKNVHYMAVGDKTAARLSASSGQEALYPEIRNDSEGLLALPALAQVHGRRVLILRGNGGRELIAQTLQQRGAEVDYCETYQRRLLPLDGAALCQTWQAQQVSSIVITSSEQLAYLYRLVPEHDKAWFLQQHLFVPSQRIAEQADTLGFSTVSTVGSAANRQLFKTLSKIGTMG